MRRLIAGLAVFAVVAAFGGPAAAVVLTQAGKIYEMDYPPPLNPFGHEGPFYMNDKGGPPPVTGSFLTFCVEQGEYFYPGHQYSVATTGVNSVKTGRTLSGYTAWLYTMFRGEYGWHLPSQFSTMTQDAYDALQYAVWAGMTTGTPTSASVGSATAEQAFGAPNGYLGNESWTSADLDADYGIGLYSFEHSGWGSYAPGDPLMYGYRGNVRVLNMTGDFQFAQDQLGFVVGQGAPNPPVPEPASIVVWSLLCVGVAAGLWRRRTAR